MSILDKVRRWIDGETAERVLEDAARDAQVKPRSKAEEFIVKIARAVEEVMQREMVPLPQGTVIIPTEYSIYLSDADDKEWQGAKRRGLEQGLYHILSERSRELAGNKRLETETLIIKFKVDGTLDKEAVRVQPSWDDAAASKTQVLKRPSESPAPTPEIHARPEPVEFRPPSEFPTAAGQSDDATRVVPRPQCLYKLEIWRNGTRLSVVPVTTRQLVLGRGSSTRPVDIPLEGDPEVSRRHLVITYEGPDSIWIFNDGRNSISIGDSEILHGQRVRIGPGTFVTVCSYGIRIVM